MIQVLHRVAQVLEQVAGTGQVGLAELASATGLRKTTLCNILRTLTDLAWLSKDDAGRYRLGPGIAQLASGPLRRNVIRQAGRACAVKLAQTVHEGVVVSVLDRGEVYVLVRILVGEEFTIIDEPYRRPTPYGTPTGRMLLAHLNDSELKDVVETKGLPAEDWPGAAQWPLLKRALADLRRSGLACDVSADGQTCSLGVPVHGPDGRAWAALGVFLPKARFTGKHKTRILKALRLAATSFSSRLSNAQSQS